MDVVTAEHNISTVKAGYWNVDDGTDRDGVGIARGSRCPHKFLRGIAQRQVGKDSFRAQPQILVRVARYAGRRRKASASHPVAGLAAVQIGAGAHIESPVLIVAGLFSPL